MRFVWGVSIGSLWVHFLSINIKNEKNETQQKTYRTSNLLPPCMVATPPNTPPAIVYVFFGLEAVPWAAKW